MAKIKRRPCQTRIPEDLFNRATGVARLTGHTMTELIIEGLELALAAKRQQLSDAIEKEIAALQQLKGN